MTEIIEVSFRPLGRDRYRPWVWRGKYHNKTRHDIYGTEEGRKVWEKHKPIKRSQLEAFRKRMQPRRIAKKPIVYRAQAPVWKQVGGFMSDGYYTVICGCSWTVRVPSEAKRVTCGRCGAITPITRVYLPGL